MNLTQEQSSEMSQEQLKAMILQGLGKVEEIMAFFTRSLQNAPEEIASQALPEVNNIIDSVNVLEDIAEETM